LPQFHCQVVAKGIWSVSVAGCHWHWMRFNVSEGSFKKYAGKNVRGSNHASPYPLSRLGAPVSLVDTAKVIEQASTTVALRTNAQLEVILEQMQSLQRQAREILERAAQDVNLLQAECRFQRVPGKVYHLYERDNGQRYFSMLAPSEYSRGMPHQFVASYRYEHGENWTRADMIEDEDRRRDQQRLSAARLLKS
jgi:hypothetical protein